MRIFCKTREEIDEVLKWIENNTNIKWFGTMASPTEKDDGLSKMNKVDIVIHDTTNRTTNISWTEYTTEWSESLNDENKNEILKKWGKQND